MMVTISLVTFDGKNYYWLLLDVVRWHSTQPTVLMRGIDVSNLVSVKTAAQQLQLRVSTLRDWRLKRKNLEFVKVGRRVCITQESIDRLVVNNTIPPLTMTGIENHERNPANGN
jgi:excisionase family DNA binding protein